jgi:hypothetical protein
MTAKRDNNQNTVILGISNTDGLTPIQITADPSTHEINVDNGDTGSDLSGDNALRDENHITTLLAVSSDDGVTPVPLYTDPANGNLLIKST